MSIQPELAALRAQMDQVNGRLVDVLHERARLSRRIGSHKCAEGIAVIDPEREQVMLQSLLQALPADGFPEASLTKILRAVFDASRELVARPHG